MRETVVGLVTPHLLRVVDLAKKADLGVNVDWHLRDALAATLSELGDLHNASALLTAFADGLEAAARQAPASRAGYIRVLQTAATSARNRARD
ncbi:hypothetical protein ACFPN1_01340 [Lysobacter yangpyeongensis]|jgi:hypothetical protein|uniref:Uncharacterized protein n=1 Tax=Lysobacter yangpyeongensis TaxID=346182 RepID=A0ABW0SIN9_9GAMM